MTLEGFRRNNRSLISRYYLGILLERLRKNMKTSGCTVFVRDLTPGPPEYEAGVLTTQPRRSVEEMHCNPFQRKEQGNAPLRTTTQRSKADDKTESSNLIAFLTFLRWR
jgi:hypothetical protein